MAYNILKSIPYVSKGNRSFVVATFACFMAVLTRWLVCFECNVNPWGVCTHVLHSILQSV